MKGEFESKIERLILESLPTATEIQILPMTPDASLRSYFRVSLSNGWYGRPTAVAMVFHSTRCPEYEAVRKVPADEAYVELSGFFLAAGIRVPDLYLDARSEGILLIEDLGDAILAELLLSNRPADQAAVAGWLEQAVEGIAALQRIPVDPAVCCFSRRFSKEVYRSELQEFSDFSLAAASLNESDRNLVNRYFDELAHSLERLPQRLVHRDYHGWNLIRGADGLLYVIDFQDALMATQFYDVVALLNDRDMHQAIGQSTYRAVLERFAEIVEAGEQWQNEYDLVLLQRDLKVAGRFAKLVSTRGLTRYGAWIPGTEERIGRTLGRIIQAGDATQQASTRRLLEVLTRYCPAIATGAASEPWY